MPTDAQQAPPNAPPQAQALRMADVTYALPDHRIALHPVTPRRAAKLLVCVPHIDGDATPDNQYAAPRITHSDFAHLHHALPPHSLLFANDVRVVPARLLLSTPTGAPLELFCLEPIAPAAPEMALAATGSVRMRCLIGRNKRWKQGWAEAPFTTATGISGVLRAERGEWAEGGFEITFSWTADGVTWAEVQQALGILPLPPYLGRAPEAEDTERYQTVFARHSGAVAAPTAGLHLDEVVLDALAAQGTVPVFATLYVSAGTFRRVESDTPAGHPMHAERIAVPAAAIRALLAHARTAETGDNVPPRVAIGTTTIRSLESAWHIGARLAAGLPLTTTDAEGLPYLNQWDAYHPDVQHLADTAVWQALLAFLEAQHAPDLHAYTALMCLPGYRYRTADGLITNFHQPGSTLLLLVSGWVGQQNWLPVYASALENGYRFLSYGDGSLLWRQGYVLPEKNL